MVEGYKKGGKAEKRQQVGGNTAEECAGHLVVLGPGKEKETVVTYLLCGETLTLLYLDLENHYYESKLGEGT